MNKSTENLKAPAMSKQDMQLSASIMHAIEIDSSFKLYAHRVITTQQFTERVKELVALHNKSVKFPEEPQDNGQISMTETKNF